MMGVYKEIQEECHSAMLHDNMNISRLTVHARRIEEVKVEMLREQGHMMVVLQRIGLRYKTSLY